MEKIVTLSNFQRGLYALYSLTSGLGFNWLSCCELQVMRFNPITCTNNFQLYFTTSTQNPALAALMLLLYIASHCTLDK